MGYLNPKELKQKVNYKSGFHLTFHKLCYICLMNENFDIKYDYKKLFDGSVRCTAYFISGRTFYSKTVTGAYESLAYRMARKKLLNFLKTKGIIINT